MSFKDGIPLLNTFDDEDTDDDDFTVSTLPQRRKKINKRHVLFCAVLLGALLLIVALIVGVTVPIVLAKQSSDAGNDGYVSTSIPLFASSSEVPASLQSMPSSAAQSMNVTPSSTVQSIMVTPNSTAVSIMVTPNSTAVSIMVTPSSTVQSIMVTPNSTAVSIMVTPNSTAVSIMVTPSSTAVSIMVTPNSTAVSIMVTPSSTVQSIMVTPNSTAVSIMVTPSSTVQSIMVAPGSTASTMVVTPSSTAVSIMVTPSSTAKSIMVTPSSTTPSMTPTPTPIPGTNFYQSKLDTRDYKVMTLDNQLRVLLISDPTSNTSAASMDIDAGSFDNPIDTLGLAHFCEHMLFLGTEKYPDDGVYSQYLTQHGGYDNAYTSSENTNYHFNIQSDYLENALDMFAQFFVAPLLTASAVDKEKNAVNAEYQKDLLIDGWRTWEVTKDVSNPAHPFHLFDIGSLETLGGDLHDKLVKFYNGHYSANKMQLVIYGRDNLTTLSNWTLNSFSNVPNRRLSPTPRNTTSFPPPYNGRIIYQYPVADSNTLSVSWQVPSMEKKYRNDISGFISRYLGQEDLGSVLYLLKREGLVTYLSAGSQVDTSTFTVLYVSVALTDEGLKGVSRVVQAVHSYIGLLRAMNETEFTARFEEYQMMRQNVYDYGERATPITYVKSLASSMRVVDDPEDFLSSPQRLLPDHTHFLSTLECMTPSNAVILITSQSLNINTNVTNATGISSHDHAPLDQLGEDEDHIPWPTALDTYEYFFKVPYGIEAISADLAVFWNTIGSGFEALKLPNMNRFIVVGDLVVEVKPDNSSAVPMEIVAAEGMSLWWLMDTGDFPEPRVNFFCDVRSANAASSPNWEALTLLFTSDIEAELTANLYDATEVGFTFDLSPTPSGMAFSLGGLSSHDNTMTILKTMLETLLSNKTSQLFDATKQGVMDGLSNYNYTEQPYNYARKYIQRVLMERPYWKNWQVLNQMYNLTQADVQSFASSELLSNVSLLCLAHGNINQSTGLSYKAVLEQWLAGRLTGGGVVGGGVVGSFQRSRVQLETSYVVSMATLNPEDPNSVVHIIYQIGPVCTVTPGSTQCDRPSLHLKLYLLLLSQMIGSECFNVLRTEQQLGYVVFCFSRENYGTGSFQVLIQSQAYNASVVYDRINNFLFDYYNNTLSPASFNKTFIEQLSVLRSTLEERDLTLGDRSNRLWAQVNSGQQQFTYNQELVNLINEGSDELNAQTMRDFYEDHILKARKLVTVLNGRGLDFPLPSDLIPIDYSQLNQTLNSFPVQ